MSRAPLLLRVGLCALGLAAAAPLTNSQFTLDFGLKGQIDLFGNPRIQNGLYGIDGIWNTPVGFDGATAFQLRSDDVLGFSLGDGGRTRIEGKIGFSKGSRASRYYLDAVTGVYRRIDLNNSLQLEADVSGSDVTIQLAEIRVTGLGPIDKASLGSQVSMNLSPYVLDRKAAGLSLRKGFGDLQFELYGARLGSSEDAMPTLAQGNADFSLAKNQYGNSYLVGGKAHYDIVRPGLSGSFALGALNVFRDPGVSSTSGARRIYLKVRSSGSSSSEIATLIDLQVVAAGRTVPLASMKLVDAKQQTADAFGVVVPNETSPGAGDSYNAGFYIYAIDLVPPLLESELAGLQEMTVRFRMRGRYVIQVSANLANWTTIFDRGRLYGPLAGTDSDDYKSAVIRRNDLGSESSVQFAFLSAYLEKTLGESKLSLSMEAGLNKETLQNALFAESVSSLYGALLPFFDSTFSLQYRTFQIEANGYRIPTRFATGIRERKNSLASFASLGFVEDADRGYASWADRRQQGVFFDGNLLPSSPYLKDEFALAEDLNGNGIPDDFEYDRKADLPRQPGESGFHARFRVALDGGEVLAFRGSGWVSRAFYDREDSWFGFDFLTGRSNTVGLFETNTLSSFQSGTYGANADVQWLPRLRWLDLSTFGSYTRSRDGIANSQLDSAESGAKHDSFGSLYRGDFLPSFDNQKIEGGLRVKLKSSTRFEKSDLSSADLSLGAFADLLVDTHFSNATYRGVILQTYAPFLRQGQMTVEELPFFDAYADTKTAREGQVKVNATARAQMFGDRLAFEMGGEGWWFLHDGDPQATLNRTMNVYTAKGLVEAKLRPLIVSCYGFWRKGFFPTTPEWDQSVFRGGVRLSLATGEALNLGLRYEYLVSRFDRPSLASSLFHSAGSDLHTFAAEMRLRLDFGTKKKDEPIDDGSKPRISLLILRSSTEELRPLLRSVIAEKEPGSRMIDLPGFEDQAREFGLATQASSYQSLARGFGLKKLYVAYQGKVERNRKPILSVLRLDVESGSWDRQTTLVDEDKAFDGEKLRAELSETL